MKKVFTLFVLSISLNAFAGTSYQFPYMFKEIKQSPATGWWDRVIGKIETARVGNDGTDLIVRFGYQGEDQFIEMHVPAKLDTKIWKRNQAVYLDKNTGHLMNLSRL